MKILSTASNLSSAFKNAVRVREVLGVLAEHGFADLLNRSELARFLPKKIKAKESYQDIPIPVRLRKAFEELGPTFVKLGQVFATRPDILPASFIDEFKQLQDNVPGAPFPMVQQTLESELGCPLRDVFLSFDEEPMAAASIAQVHGAILHDGQEVAVKIQRPGIEKTLQTDVSILQGLAVLLAKYVPESRPFNPVTLVDEFFKTTLHELNFLIEANNLRRIRKNMEVFPKIAIPEVHSKWSTKKILVMERFRGIRLSEREKIVEAGIDPKEILEEGTRAFFHQVMNDGLFHGDLHAGNLFVLNDGRIAMIDFGIVGRLTRRVQSGVVQMFLSIVDEDYETLATEYLYLCPSTGPTQLAALQKDLMDTISPYIGMPLGAVNVGQLLLQSSHVAVKHHLVVPRELMLLFKAILSVESIGRALDPDFDMLKVGHSLAKELVVGQHTRERFLREVLTITRDLQALSQTVPRQLRLFIKRWTNDDYQLHFRNKDTLAVSQSIQRLSKVISYSTLTIAAVAVGIALLFTGQGPFLYSFSIPAWLFLGLAGILGFFSTRATR